MLKPTSHSQPIENDHSGELFLAGRSSLVVFYREFRPFKTFYILAKKTDRNTL